MKIKFLGAGSAFTLKGFQTNILIEENGKYLLLDAGGDIRFSLKEAKLSYRDIDSLYISHGHGDHMGGMEYLGFNSYFDPNKDKIKLYGHHSVLGKAWDGGLRAGMESLEGLIANMHTYFSTKALDDNGSFFWESIKFELVQCVHIMTCYSIVPSFGLMITPPDSFKKIYWTSDSQYAPSQLIKFYNSADIILQDCETSPAAYKSRVHAHMDDLCGLPAEVRSKMILDHTGDNMVNEDGNLTQEAIDWCASSGFKAIAYKGMEIEV